MGDVSPIIEPGGLFHDFCPDKPLNSFLLTLHLYKLLGPPPAQQCLGTYPTLYPPVNSFSPTAYLEYVPPFKRCGGTPHIEEFK